MTAANLAGLVGSVILISCGQVLFKYVGLRIAEAGIRDPRALVVAATAFGIYGVATVLWILVLRSVPLSRAYPFMAASFILVPIASSLFYGEILRPQYIVGVLLIAVGVVVASTSS